MRAASRRFPIASFTIVAIAISWAIWSPLLIGNAVPRRTALLLYYAGVIGPTAAAFVCSRGASLWQPLRLWRVPLRWYVAAIAIPFLVRAAALVMVSGWKIEFRPIGEIAWTTLLMFLLVPFEEIGWRGYLLPVTQRRHSPLVSSLIVGAIWALWHLPLAWATIGYQQSEQPWRYMAWFTVSILPISCLATWIFNGSGGSVALASLFHIAVNLADFVAVLPRATGEAVLFGTTVITAAIVTVLRLRDPWYRDFPRSFRGGSMRLDEPDDLP